MHRQISAVSPFFGNVSPRSGKAASPVSDSLLEEAGFEPLVPCEITEVSRAAHVASVIHDDGKVGANEN
jgi:hypothetical protein